MSEKLKIHPIPPFSKEGIKGISPFGKGGFRGIYIFVFTSTPS
jgi:hypothetical protein